MGHVIPGQKFRCDGADAGVDGAVRNHRAEFGIRLADGPLLRVEIEVSRQPRLRQSAPSHLFVQHELPQGVQSIRARKPACHADDCQRIAQRSFLVLEVQSDIPIPPTFPRTMGIQTPEHAGGWVLIGFQGVLSVRGEQTTHPWINTNAGRPLAGSCRIGALGSWPLGPPPQSRIESALISAHGR